MIGNAILNVMLPVSARDCRIPRDAAELWMIAVMMVPTRSATIGLLSIRMISLNCGISASGLTESPMRSMPNIKMAKPTQTEPTSFFLSPLMNMIRTMPISATIGEKLDGFRS